MDAGWLLSLSRMRWARAYVYKYLGRFSVQIKGEEMRSTRWTCAQSGFLQEEDSKAQQPATDERHDCDQSKFAWYYC